MNFQRPSRKILKRCLYRLYKILGIDSVSRARIVVRNDLRKIGSNYGGWVVPERMLNSDSICYCVGCGEDISFDLGLINIFGCHVYGFDPTPRAIDYVKKSVQGNPRYHFSDVGLWDTKNKLKFFAPKETGHVSHSLVNLQGTEAYILVDVDRLSHLMRKLGHHKLDLLKIDIEGAEYNVIKSIIEDGVNVRVLCVEFDEYHSPLDTGYSDRIRHSVNSLMNNGYSLVHTQGNGNYTFVHEDDLNP